MLDTCRDISLPVKNQRRLNESAGQVDVLTRLEVPVMGDPGHV